MLKPNTRKIWQEISNINYSLEWKQIKWILHHKTINLTPLCQQGTQLEMDRQLNDDEACSEQKQQKCVKIGYFSKYHTKWSIYEPLHDKTSKMSAPSEDSVWSESSLSA